MRPQGEIRSTIFSTLRVTGPLTQRDLAERAQVGYDATRYCVQNAVRAGVLQIVGREKRAHCDKWVALYDVPREQQRGPKLAFVDLSNALSRWR